MQNIYALKNNKTQTLFEISDSTIAIGRREHSDICINDTDASRDHAKIYTSIGGVVIADLASRNGTRVNGRKIDEPTRLVVGDVIQIGNESFTLELESATPATRLSRPPFTPAVPASDAHALKFIFANLLNLFPFGKALSSANDPATLDHPNVQATIEKYLTFFTNNLGKVSALALFFFKDGQPIAIQCLTPAPTNEQWTIGRAENNSIVVNDLSISKKHAKIVRMGSTWMLIDEGSTNGLHFNGHKEAQIGLMNGMIVSLGDIFLYVRILPS